MPLPEARMVEPLAPAFSPAKTLFAIVENATINGGNLSEVKNAHRAKNFTTVVVIDPNRSFEAAVRPWWIKLDWGLLGTVGRLPLFAGPQRHHRVIC
jgi:hypothetical protein